MLDLSQTKIRLLKALMWLIFSICQVPYQPLAYVMFLNIHNALQDENNIIFLSKKMKVKIRNI